MPEEEDMVPPMDATTEHGSELPMREVHEGEDMNAVAASGSGTRITNDPDSIGANDDQHVDTSTNPFPPDIKPIIPHFPPHPSDAHNTNTSTNANPINNTNIRPPHVFSTQAPRLRIARQVYNSIEYPGYITSPSSSSTPNFSSLLSSAPAHSNSISGLNTTTLNPIQQLNPQPRSSNPSLNPTQNPSFLKALYTLGVLPSQIPSLVSTSGSITGAPTLASGANGMGGTIATGPIAGMRSMMGYTPTPIDAVFNNPDQGLELNWRPKGRNLVLPVQVEVEVGGSAAAGEADGEAGAGHDDDQDRPSDPDQTSTPTQTPPKAAPQTQTQLLPWPAANNPHSRPINGERVGVGRILVRVVLRRKRRKREVLSGDGAVGEAEAMDVDTPEVVQPQSQRTTRSSRRNVVEPSFIGGDFGAGTEGGTDTTGEDKDKIEGKKGKGKGVTFVNADVDVEDIDGDGNRNDVADPSASSSTAKPSGSSDPTVNTNKQNAEDRRAEERREAGKEREEGGMFKIEVMGIVKNTVRFRSMADYQFTPFRANGQIAALVEKWSAADPRAILDYKVDDLDEQYFVPLNPLKSQSRSGGLDGDTIPVDPVQDDDVRPADPLRESVSDARDGDIGRFRSTMWGSSPGIFSRQRVPHNFEFMPNPSSREIEVVDPATGQLTKRLINMHRAKLAGIIAIRDNEETTPMEIGADIKKMVPGLNKELLGLLNARFAERPVWQRAALVNQFTVLQQKELYREKSYYPSVAYTFANGNFKDALIRFGYDPRRDPSAYQYQRVFFRFEAGGDGLRPQFRRGSSADPDKAKDGSGSGTNRLSKTHIFDGKMLSRGQAHYQLCDIVDPFLAKFIHDPAARTEYILGESGWYKPRQWIALKTMIRSRWAALADPTDEQKVAEAEAHSSHMLDLVKDFQNYTDMNAQDVIANEDGEAEQTTGTGAEPKRRAGRPQGVLNRTRRHIQEMEGGRGSDRWRRKNTGNVPMRREDQEAIRLRTLLDRQQKDERQARRKDTDGDVMEVDFDIE